MNDLLAGFIGCTIGVVAMVVAFTNTTTPDTVLREVGIERIEYCHNTQSNWYEIVWKEGHK